MHSSKAKKRAFCIPSVPQRASHRGTESSAQSHAETGTSLNEVTVASRAVFVHVDLVKNLVRKHLRPAFLVVLLRGIGTRQ